jgi:hypothetical protein
MMPSNIGEDEPDGGERYTAAPAIIMTSQQQHRTMSSCKLSKDVKLWMLDSRASQELEPVKVPPKLQERFEKAQKRLRKKDGTPKRNNSYIYIYIFILQFHAWER